VKYIFFFGVFCGPQLTCVRSLLAFAAHLSCTLSFYQVLILNFAFAYYPRPFGFKANTDATHLTLLVTHLRLMPLVFPCLSFPFCFSSSSSLCFFSSFASIIDEMQNSTDPEKSPSSQDAAATTAEPVVAGVPEVAYTVFSHRVKIFIIIMSATSSLFSPVSSLIYLPALDVLADFYHVSVGRINLSVTTYMILQGLAPMFFGDMADQMGRRPVYILTLCIYLVANIALAMQSNYAALLVLRALQSMGSSGTIALGNAVMADIATPAERSGYISYVQAGMMMGPAIAPTIGGLLTHFWSWRALFWFLVIASGVYLAVYIPLLPETCRKIVENGSIPPQGWNRSVWNFVEDRKIRRRGEGDTTDELERQQRKHELAAKRNLAIPNPLKALLIIVEKDVALIMLFTSLMVTGFYMIMVPIPSVFGDIYKFNQLQIGLCYM